MKNPNLVVSIIDEKNFNRILEIAEIIEKSDKTILTGFSNNSSEFEENLKEENENTKANILNLNELDLDFNDNILNKNIKQNNQNEAEKIDENKNIVNENILKTEDLNAEKLQKDNKNDEFENLQNGKKLVRKKLDIFKQYSHPDKL
jgi:pyrimidine operon attenuation protein/uracil phosphoribosyltransferase